MSQTVETKTEKQVETIVKLKPIVRSGWLPSGHDGEWKFTNCETWIVPFRSMDTGIRQTGLTDEDEKSLEKALRMNSRTLSKYNEEYWSKYQIRIHKDGLTLDLNNPKSKLDYFVLKANPLVASSLADVAYNPSAMFYLSSEIEEAKTKNSIEKSERTAIKKYGTLSLQDMIDVLRVYSLQEGKGQVRYTKSTPADLIESTLYTKVKESPEEFLRIVDDASFKTKVFIDKLVSKRILIKSGSKYIVHGGDSIGATLQDAIDFLEDPHNQDVKVALLSKLNAQE